MHEINEACCAICFYFGIEVPAEFLIVGVDFTLGNPNGRCPNPYHANLCAECADKIDKGRRINITECEKLR
jgi:hypothetical protein